MVNDKNSGHRHYLCCTAHPFLVGYFCFQSSAWTTALLCNHGELKKKNECRHKNIYIAFSPGCFQVTFSHIGISHFLALEVGYVTAALFLFLFLHVLKEKFNANNSSDGALKHSTNMYNCLWYVWCTSLFPLQCAVLWAILSAYKSYLFQEVCRSDDWYTSVW